MATNIFPALQGGGMAAVPPALGYPLYVVLLVELVKFPLTRSIPYEIAYRGAVFNSISNLGGKWSPAAISISTALYVTYHLPFDFSFSAVYFNIIIGLVAILLFKKSESIIPPIIFHTSINFFAIMASWGYYLGR